MRQYEFFTKECVMDTQASLQGRKEAAVAKIAQRKEELAAEGSSKIFITEEEAHLARLKLQSQEDESDIHYFNDEEIQKIKDVIENGYRIPFTSRSGNTVNSALYYPKQGKFFLFLLYSGLRCGEASVFSKRSKLLGLTFLYFRTYSHSSILVTSISLTSWICAAGVFSLYLNIARFQELCQNLCQIRKNKKSCCGSKENKPCGKPSKTVGSGFKS